MLAKPYLRSCTWRTDSGERGTGFPFNLPAVRDLQRVAFHPDVTFLVGENGSGKSTLLEAIAIAWGFNAEGGTQNFNFSTAQAHTDLHRHLRLIRSARKPTDGFFLRAESFFNLASNMDLLDKDGGGPPIKASYGGTSLHEQSHGESFLALVMHRFGGHGLYLLDEPEAALSPTRQLALLRRMHDLVGRDSQFIVATHSAILMGYPGARIYQLDPAGIAEVAYEDTEHYAVTKRFMLHRQTILQELLA